MSGIRDLSATDRDCLRQTPLFGDLDAAALQWLLEAARVVDHGQGGVLFAQGEAANRFFVVLGGRVKLFALTEAGDQSIIEVIEPGFSFAEGAIFGSGICGTAIAALSHL